MAEKYGPLSLPDHWDWLGREHLALPEFMIELSDDTLTIIPVDSFGRPQPVLARTVRRSRNQEPPASGEGQSG